MPSRYLLLFTLERHWALETIFGINKVTFLELHSQFQVFPTHSFDLSLIILVTNWEWFINLRMIRCFLKEGMLLRLVWFNWFARSFKSLAVKSWEKDHVENCGPKDVSFIISIALLHIRTKTSWKAVKCIRERSVRLWNSRWLNRAVIASIKGSVKLL